MIRSTAALFLVLAVLSAPGRAASVERVERAVARRPTGAAVGVSVRRLSDGREIVAIRGNDLFEFASNAKLFTTAAALVVLKPEYQFKTSLIANGTVRDGALEGDLVVVGGGDPNLSGRFHAGDAMAVPRAMAEAVRRHGIVRISGELVMDDRLFDRVLRAPGWAEEDALWWYAAPVSALSFNDNCVAVRVDGGSPAKISIYPDVGILRATNQVQTASSEKGEGISFRRLAPDLIEISGRLRPRNARTDDITVTNPPLYFAAALRAALAEQKVEVAGAARLVREGETAQPAAREIFAWRSPLTDAVNVANRRSQNFCAEQIFKTLGAARSGWGTFESGAKAVAEFVRSLGFPEGAVTLTDGSGLSPGNRATPQAVSALLQVMHGSALRQVFLDSLAVNGDAETTLRHRLTERGAVGRIRAKTGTIRSRGVSALSGYAVAADGEVYAFSILSNGFSPGQLGPIRLMEDAICRALLDVPDP